jgi:hypothetical protein|tara:strand:+ start:172 stop:384 length:213 start_codon:yes stop_codon:yes gene_type:complete
MPDSRRLSDKIIDAHQLACERGRREIADALREALEIELSAIGGDKIERRSETEMIEAAFDLHEKAFGHGG